MPDDRFTPAQKTLLEMLSVSLFGAERTEPRKQETENKKGTDKRLQHEKLLSVRAAHIRNTGKTSAETDNVIL